MISTGKTGHAKSGHVGTLLMSGQHQVKGSTSKRAVSHGDGHTIAGQSDQEHQMTAFNVSGHRVQPMAHLGIRNCSPTAKKQVQIICIYIYIYTYICTHTYTRTYSNIFKK